MRYILGIGNGESIKPVPNTLRKTRQIIHLIGEQLLGTWCDWQLDQPHYFYQLDFCPLNGSVRWSHNTHITSNVFLIIVQSHTRNGFIVYTCTNYLHIIRVINSGVFQDCVANAEADRAVSYLTKVCSPCLAKEHFLRILVRCKKSPCVRYHLPCPKYAAGYSPGYFNTNTYVGTGWEFFQFTTFMWFSHFIRTNYRCR